MSNSINIDITASDRASVVIGNLQKNMSSLSDSFKGSFLGNFGASAALAGLSAIKDAVGGIKNAFLDAAKIQTQFVTAANSTALNLKVNIDTGFDIQKKLGKEIAKAAAAQPGDNQDYVNIANGISGSIARAFAGNPEGFLKATSKATSNAGLLANSAGIDGVSAGSTISRFINGSSGFAQLRNIDFFEKNQDLVFQIDKLSKAQGLDPKNLQHWTQKQRIDIFNAATSAIVTPAFLARLNNTADAKLQSFKAYLFDPQVGLFGFLREMPSLGDRSVLDSFNGLLTTISFLGASASRISAMLGFGFDPLAPLGNLIDWFNDLLVGVSKYLDGLSLKQVKAFNISSIFNAAIDSFSSMVKNFDGSKTGAVLAGITNGILNSITRMFLTTNWSKVGAAVSKLAFEAFRTIVSYFLNIDYGAVLQGLFSIFQAICRYFQGGLSFVWSGFMRDLGMGLEYTVTSIKKVWDDFVGFLKGILDGVTSKLTAAIPEPLRQAAQGNVNPGAIANDIWKGVTGDRNFITGEPNKPLGVTPLAQPQASAKPVAYAPNVTVNAAQGQDESTIAQMVVDKIAAGYTRYKQEALSV